MVSKSKTQFLKNDYFNNIKSISIKNQSNHKMMPSTVLDYSPSTTSRSGKVYSGRPYAGLQAITEDTTTRHLIIP